MQLFDISLLIGIGIIAGAWNAIAGGATLFSFPVLMAVGLPPVVANATNFLALAPANLFALPPYMAELRQIGRRLIPIVAFSGAGALIGSILLIVSDPGIFELLIPFLLLAATALFFFGDRLRAQLLAIAGDAGSERAVLAALFCVSIYGGYFGAGVGVILLALGQLLGYRDFHMANAIKNLTATSFTFISIALFGVSGLIAWPEAITMMIGSAIGGYAGGKVAKRVNQAVLRMAVTGFGLILSAVYFYRAFF
ncbi:MAG: sulfite exporter TauE/SafE family protein [Pseudomonadota bacterium]